MNGQEKVHSAKEVAALLGIQNSTIRKYAQLLEKAGYHIHKNEQGHRGFFDKDVLIFRQIIEITKHPDMSLENAINVVVSTRVRDDMSDRDTKKVAETSYITRTEFDEYQQRLEGFQRAMYEKLIQCIEQKESERDEKINKILDHLERQERLEIERTKMVEEEKETRRQIAAAAKQKKWWSFWK